MTAHRIILVTGATGAQGGSVAKHLLADGRFGVRCLTRNPASPQAQALADAGAEIVYGDFDDIASLSMAMQGVYGVFGVTNFWEHFDKEYQHGKNLVMAVAASRVDYFIYSSLPSAGRISRGRYQVPHFDGKAAVQEYASSIKPDSAFVHVAGYYDNFYFYCLPEKANDGSYVLRLPQGDTRYASCAVEDLGGVVTTMFHHPEVYKKRTVGVVGADMPLTDYAATMTKVLNLPVRYEPVSRDDYAALGFPGAGELADMYSFNREFILNRQIDLIESHGLHPSMQTFGAWLTKHAPFFLKALTQEKQAV